MHKMHRIVMDLLTVAILMKLKAQKCSGQSHYSSYVPESA